MSSTPIVVSLHEGDPLSRAGLSKLLGQCPGFVLPTDPAEDGPDQVSDVAVTLTDPATPDAMTRLRKLITDMDRRVVLIVDTLQPPHLESVVEAGLRSVVWRGELSTETMNDAVRRAYDDATVPADLMSTLLERQQETQQEAPPPPPSDAVFDERELAVLRMVADGLSYREIATELSYTQSTIKLLLHQIMARHGFRNRTHAVAYAIRARYI